MSRIKLMLDVAKDMRSLADSIEAACKAMESDECVATPKSEQPEKAPKAKPAKEPEITLEKVRGVLADKSRAGFTAEVRGIIKKYGAEKLSDISPENYAAVLKDAEVLGDG